MPEENGEDEDVKADTRINDMNINVGRFCQWLTGQAHVPLIHAGRENF